MKAEMMMKTMRMNILKPILINSLEAKKSEFTCEKR